MLEGKSLTICMFESSTHSLKNLAVEWATTIGQLKLGLLEDGTWVVLNKI